MALDDVIHRYRASEGRRRMTPKEAKDRAAQNRFASARARFARAIAGRKR